MTDLCLFQFSPIQVEMDPTAQRLELIQFLSSNQIRCRLMDCIGLGLGGCQVHKFANEFVVEIQGRTHTQSPFDMPVSYALGGQMSIVLAGNPARPERGRRQTGIVCDLGCHGRLGGQTRAVDGNLYIIAGNAPARKIFQEWTS